ncbi:MAG: RiPP maturation radical SAM C-methyltransferase [Holophagales bacterium]|nr:RiPP maturation radical SAM C-methyltransferase [Holophagales bacterium]
MGRYPRILLINMPFAGIDRPSLGLSLLQASARARGHLCDIAYLNLAFAERVGRRPYEQVANSGPSDSPDSVPYSLMAGEWMFARQLFGDRAVGSPLYVERILRPGLSARGLAHVLRMAERVAPFLRACLHRIRWRRYDLVGFTSTFEQNLPSLCLAHALKQRYPHLRIAFGGANCEEEMGRELGARFPFVDAVCLGEGDVAFPAFLDALARGEESAPLPGIVHRLGAADGAARELVEAEPVAPVGDLDALPVPSFDDYFSQLAHSPLGHQLVPWIQMEGSRGCWWGAKQHCTFCGLNGETMGFRKKSSDRLIEELRSHVRRYRTPYVSFTDNILDHRAFEELVPALEQHLPGLCIFFEVKSNLKRPQVAALARAGIREVQPGIESFSSAVLARMRKGVSGLQNLAFLRYCAEAGVRPLWNLLYGFPGEEPEEYVRQLRLLERASHLEPAASVCRIRLDRFSPNFTDARRLGFRRPRPKAAYRHLYPFGDASRARLAYFFDYDYADGRDPADYTRGLVRFWRRMVEHDRRGSLALLPRSGGRAQIVDSRFNRRLGGVLLDRAQAAVYRACAEPRGLEAILAHARRALPEEAFGRDRVAAFLGWMEAQLWVASEEGRYLAMALFPPSSPSFPSQGAAPEVRGLGGAASTLPGMPLGQLRPSRRAALFSDQP